MLVLASSSPRRKALLGLLVKAFDVLPADIDETPYAAEEASDYVMRMAQQKAQASAVKYQQQAKFNPRAVFLASDTSVVVDGQILGKPASFDEAKAMLRKLSGRSHQVMTSLCLCDVNCQRLVTDNVITEVTFRAISDLEIEQYWRTGEPQDKAGAYAIQGIGAIFVEFVCGSYSAVVGLPLFETSQLLAQFGIHSLKEMSHA